MIGFKDFNVLKKRQGKKTKRVLAIASAGGHWLQLLRLRPAFDDCTVTYATTLTGLPEEFGLERAHIIPDFSRKSKFKTISAIISILLFIIRIKPDVIVTTGAAPGLVALILGKAMGKNTIWIDSIANAEELSMSGKIAGKWANTWLTQWPHLQNEIGPYYKGSVF
ncbi:MAG: hypothetical protein AAF228_13820 [Pseudomonadota bacterium]